MKSKLVLLLLLSPFSFLLSPCLAQIPQGFNYQAIARDGSGNVLDKNTFEVMFSIQSLPTGGTIFWKELHSSVPTNSFGLFSVVVGHGTRQEESKEASFGQIDWTVTPKYLKTEIYYAGSWKDLGTSQLQSVPYSLTAGNLAGTVEKLGITGTTSLNDEALFEVKNKNGNTVFAVYNEGVRVYVSDGNKGLKGGFAVGGFGTDKAESQKYLVVSKDSVRIYLDTNPATKPARGGFAVGGYDLTKAVPEEYLRVTRDSTRVYVKEPQKGLKGGFAVGGFDATKASTGNYLNLTPQNYFIGHQAGKNNNTGIYNNFLGFEAGFENTDGGNNSFVGYKAGRANLTGSANTFLGNSAGTGNLTGSQNTFIGTSSGIGFTAGTGNIFMGVSAGAGFLNGSFNIFIGNGAGYGFLFPLGTTGGQNNVAVGTGAGFRLNSGYNNLFLGNLAGYANTVGFDNVFLGFKAGYINTEGYANVFIGRSAGYNNSTGYQNVFIGDNSGNKNTSGSQNTFVGLQAGSSNTIGGANAFVGWNAGLLNTEGSNNAFFGLGAGYNNTTAYYNTFIGFSSGLANKTGASNTYLGSNAGRSNMSGSYNVVIGESSAYSASSGSGNTIIGSEAGYNLTSGNNNIFLGNGAGYNETSISNRLYIENSAAGYSGSLIYGEFDNDYLRFNAAVDMYGRLHFPAGGAVLWVANTEALWFNGTYYSWGFGGTYNYFAKPVIIGNPGNPGSYMLYVAGNAWTTGTWGSSDIRWKKNISVLGDELSRIVNLNPVKYEWRKDEFPEIKFDSGDQIGLIAQDVEKIFPELIKTDANGYKAVAYDKLSVILVKGMKEQQKQIDELKQIILEIREEIASSLRSSQ
ncbi:MAG: tail fiber domain-containing protein [Bacteroidales bacterium]|jgi:hypothetical protein|nr:tail fiber domain-containing protein [Bacteroidales bacterium]